VQYEYDELGNLVKVTQPDGLVIEYVIDGQGRRVGKKVDGVLVQGLLYKDQLEPIATSTDRFIYATSTHSPDVVLKGGQSYRIVTDHLGSPRLVVNVADGAVVQRLDYDEFGKPTLDTGAGSAVFGFAGGVYDGQTGLVRFGARDYDPGVGRWGAIDPSLFSDGSSNLYIYTANDPINLIDRNGEVAVPLVIGGLIVTTVAVLTYEVWLTTPKGKEALRDLPLPPWAGPAESRRSKPGAPGRTCPPPTSIPGARPKTSPAPPLIVIDPKDRQLPNEGELWDNEGRKSLVDEVIEGLGDWLQHLGG